MRTEIVFIDEDTLTEEERAEERSLVAIYTFGNPRMVARMKALIEMAMRREEAAYGQTEE